jgi:hypothetical protein
MADFIGLCVIAILALSPLLRRFYIDRFWVHTRGTVIRVEGIINNIPEGGEWVWAPIIEYQAAGQQFSSRVFPFRHQSSDWRSVFQMMHVFFLLAGSSHDDLDNEIGN